jgi:SAM-dependent methyltransferase
MPSPTVDEVKSQMDALYAANKAYVSSLPFDVLRGKEIQAATVALARSSLDGNLEFKGRVLDVGCGEGGIASFWPWPKQNIVGIEISPVAVEKARKAHQKVTYYAMPVERVVEVPGAFQMAVAQESIEHWTEVPNSLKALRRKLHEGGTLVLTTPNRDSLHCRMARKYGFEPPYCSYDHIHEFGFQELIDTVEAAGFVHREARGVHLAPYWTIGQMGQHVRHLTDNDVEVNRWLNEIGRTCPEYAFIQCHRFEAV